MRIDPSYSHHAYFGEQTLHAKASEKLAHDRAIERTDREKVRHPQASERLTFGEFLERENLKTVRDVEFETVTIEREVERAVIRDEPDGKYGSPSLGDVFETPPDSRETKPESLTYDKDGKPHTPATSGFTAVMVDVIA